MHVKGVLGRTVWPNTQIKRAGGFTGKRCSGLLFWPLVFSFPVMLMYIKSLDSRTTFLSLVLCSLKVSFLLPTVVSSIFHPGLPASAFGPYLVSSSPFPPEEEVFSISIERERRAPITWQLDNVEEKMKEDSSLFVFPNSPPPEPVDTTIVQEPATPSPKVNFLSSLVNLASRSFFFRFRACALLQPHEE